MESKTNYSLVGLIVLILLVGLITSTLWLSVGFDNKKYDVYVVYMREAVSGLSDDAPVKFNGVKVGYVKSIRLNANDPQQVQLLLSIEHGIPVTTSTTATLISQGITGVTYVGLAANSSDLTLLKPEQNEPYPIIPYKPSLFNKLDSALKGVSENINTLTDDVRQVFNKENTENLRLILVHSNKFAQMLEDRTPDIDRFIKNLAKASDKFPNLATQFGVSMDSLAQQTIPSATQLLRRLNHVAINIEKITTDLQHNPSAIIRGTASPKKGPGE